MSKSGISLMLGIILLTASCNFADSKNGYTLVDPNATVSVKQLYAKLQKMSKTGFIFGHQDALSYGMGWKYEQEPGRCDVYELTGDFPGVFGWDLGHLETGCPFNIDTVDFSMMRMNIINVHKMGAINTISWHPLNPVTGGNAWDNSPTVKYILPGGTHHEQYNEWLNRIGGFFKSLKTESGEQVPIIWRPYHEHNGGWFWWGESSTTADEYVSLWQYTVHYFRDTLDIHNLLWTYSPCLFKDESEYLAKYPGDEFVDILGCDVYDKGQNNLDYKKNTLQNINILKKLGQEKNKVYALTETGLNGLGDEHWWSESLLPAIDSSGVAWVLVWRNAHMGHFYASYKGHKSELDFINFYNHPKTFFMKDVKNFKID